MIDKPKLIDALLYEGLRNLYTGNLLRDAGGVITRKRQRCRD